MSQQSIFRRLFCIISALLCLIPFCPPARADDAPLRVGVMRARPPIAFRYPDDPERRLSGGSRSCGEAWAGDGKAQCFYRGQPRRTSGYAGKRKHRLYLRSAPASRPRRSARADLDNQFRHKSPYSRRKLDIYINSEQDYKGHTIALLDDSEKYQPVAESYGARTIKVFSYQEGFALLAAGKADAFVVPSGEIASYLVMMEQVPISASWACLWSVTRH